MGLDEMELAGMEDGMVLASGIKIAIAAARVATIMRSLIQLRLNLILLTS
mgnify:CR=1 FL=1